MEVAQREPNNSIIISFLQLAPSERKALLDFQSNAMYHDIGPRDYIKYLVSIFSSSPKMGKSSHIRYMTKESLSMEILILTVILFCNKIVGSLIYLIILFNLKWIYSLVIE